MEYDKPTGQPETVYVSGIEYVVVSKVTERDETEMLAIRRPKGHVVFAARRNSEGTVWILCSLGRER